MFDIKMMFIVLIKDSFGYCVVVVVVNDINGLVVDLVY